MTVQELINKFGELGALQCRLEFYDATAGYKYEIHEVYTAEDDDDVVCIDVERVD